MKSKKRTEAPPEAAAADLRAALKKTKRELADTEERLKIVFERASDAYYLNDLKGNLVDGNTAAEELAGYKKDELIGKNISNLALLPTDQLPKAFKLIARNALGLPAGPAEITIKRKDGRTIAVELRTYPVKLKGRRLILGIARDVSEHKQIVSKLNESENRYRAIFENTGAATIICDREGIINRQNSEMANMSGYSDVEVEGKMRWMEFIPAEDLKAMLANHQKRQVDPASAPRRYEIRFITKKGIIRNAMITVDKIPGQDEFVSSIHDITDLRNAERDLTKSLGERDVLLKEIHHRVKNNLMIISSLFNLQAGYIKDKESRDFFKESQNRAKAMALIHERLYGSKDLKKIDFGEYLRTLAQDLIQAYVPEDRRVRLDLDVENIMVDINTTVPLGLIVNELITNCIKHGYVEGRAGEIRVVFRKNGDTFVLVVGDNGPGFPAEVDFRNTASLGLRLVNSLTGQIEGTIALKKGRGAEFTITFKEQYQGR